jgi:RNA polymerase sigma-32 factor
MRAVKAFPLLTAEEEFELGTKLKQNNDLEAAQKLIVSHLRLVVSIARGYLGYGLPQSDLIQEGNIGLMKAVKRFDPDRGVRLVSFAMHWIKAEMNEYIVRNWRLVKTATTKAQRKLFFNLRSMKNGHEISLDAHTDDDGDESFSPIAYLEDESPEPSVFLENQQTETMQSAGLSKALMQLDARSRRVLEARWLTENKSSTLHDLAAEFGVSAERIRQIEQKAMLKIKSFMQVTA